MKSFKNKDDVVRIISEIIFPNLEKITKWKEWQEDLNITNDCYENAINILFQNATLDTQSIKNNKLIDYNIRIIIQYIVYINYLNNNEMINIETTQYTMEQLQKDVTLIENIIPQYDQKISIEDNINKIIKALEYNYIIKNLKTLSGLITFQDQERIMFKIISKKDTEKKHLTDYEIISKEHADVKMDFYIGNLETRFEALCKKIKSSDAKILFAKINKKEVGFIHYRDNETYIFIEHLATHTEHTRKGIASTLINHIKNNNTKKAIYLFSDHPDSKSEAYNFYTKQNFKAIPIESFNNGDKNIPNTISNEAIALKKNFSSSMALYYLLPQ